MTFASEKQNLTQDNHVTIHMFLYIHMVCGNVYLSISRFKNMKRQTTLLAVLALVLFGFSSCYSTDNPDINKITYIVTGTTFDVIYQNPNGDYEYVYDREGVFKVYQEDVVGDPVFLLAKGSDDVTVRIRIKDGIDTVRKARPLGLELVYIDLNSDNSKE